MAKLCSVKIVFKMIKKRTRTTQVAINKNKPVPGIIDDKNKPIERIYSVIVPV